MTLTAQKAHAELPFGRTLSLDQAAAFLGVSRRTIYNRIRTGRLETVRTLGGSQRVLVDSLSRHRATSDVPLAHSGANVARRPVS